MRLPVETPSLLLLIGNAYGNSPRHTVYADFKTLSRRGPEHSFGIATPIRRPPKNVPQVREVRYFPFLQRMLVNSLWVPGRGPAGLHRGEPSASYASRSRIPAAPCPPPTHIVTMP
jgi:hypothetical protein